MLSITFQRLFVGKIDRLYLIIGCSCFVMYQAVPNYMLMSTPSPTYVFAVSESLD